MLWTKLVDRCLLFTEAPGGLLKALLKEAEMELANRLELYDALYTIIVPTTLSGLGLWSQNPDIVADHNYTKLPNGYLKDISVTFKGSKLRKMSEEEIYRSGNDNTVQSGSPTAYAISGDFIVFNTNPAIGDKILLHYKATMEESTTDKVLTLLDYLHTSTGKIWLDTPLGSKLNSYKIWWENEKKTLSAGSTTSFPGHIAGPPDKYHANNLLGNAADVNYNVNITASEYTISALLGSGVVDNSADASVLALSGSMVRVIDYRNVAPAIPERFHSDLCNYAIAIANAKTAPELYDKYWLKWELNMERLNNESRDRDLIFSIREEI